MYSATCDSQTAFLLDAKAFSMRRVPSALLTLCKVLQRLAQHRAVSPGNSGGVALGHVTGDTVCCVLDLQNS